jgi:transposase
MFYDPSDVQVYLALGSTDMRKAINSLSILVQEHLELNPFSGSFFVFSNRRRTMVKILYWDRNGFCIWQKKLERHHFIWPESQQEVMQIEQRQLRWLLEGLDIFKTRAHDTLKYSTVV